MILPAVLLLCAVSVAAQPIDLRIVRDPAIEDYDISWVFWFETHGRAYLHEAISDRPIPWDTPASRRWRGEAVDALVALLDDEQDAVRAAAVLGLGRMGHAPVLDHVLPSLEKQGNSDGQADNESVCLLLDPSDEVRLSAWAALGLIDNERSRAALALPPSEAAEELDLAAQALAIGLLQAPTKAHLRWLIARLDDPRTSLEAKRWCVASLRQHDDPAMDPAFDAALAKLPSTFLISEVLLNAQYAERRGGADWLVKALRYHPDTRAWAGYRALSAVGENGAFGSTPRRLAMETRIAATLSLARQPIAKDKEDQREVLGDLRRRIVAGNSAQAMDFNRGFDLISYAMHCDVERADLDLLYDQLRGITQVPPDDPQVVEELEDGEQPEPEDLLFRQSDNEVRGYAALATGLLIRRATEGTALFVDRPIVGREAIEIERLKRRFGLRLMRAVADSREPVSYRAACALGLGLTGDARYREELAIELGRLREGDEAVLGYGVLALAMLGDDRAAVPARRYLARPGRIASPGDRLGRHAALQAIAILGERGGDDTDAALKAAWGRDTWISLSAADAVAKAGRYDALPGMIAAAGNESAAWRRSAALSLGIVFDRTSPSRLAPLIEGTNPTLSFRNGLADQNRRRPLPRPLPDGPAEPTPLGWPRVELHALGDPFFFNALRIPASQADR